MTSYCSTRQKATVVVTAPEQERIVSNAPPINITVTTLAGGTYVDYTHTMNQPINVNFAENITDVQLNDVNNDWVFSQQYPSSNPSVHAKCPTLSYAPDSYSPSDSLHINGKNLYSNFDPLQYNDNSGTCTYRVYFGQNFRLTITDSSGTIYTHDYSSNPSYQVSCDEDCPPGYCRCECINYPGYCCINTTDGSIL